MELAPASSLPPKAFLTLLRRREVWVPTPAGCLVLSLVALLLLLLLGRGVYPYLAPTQPIQAELLVVEAWISDTQVQPLAELYQRGGYRLLVTTGMAFHPADPRREFAEGHAAYGALRLERLGFPPDRIAQAPAPRALRRRTWEAAQAFRRWLQAEGLQGQPLNLLSSGAHTRRSWQIYQRVLAEDGSRVGVIALPAESFDPERWWTSSAGVRTVLGEVLAYVYFRLAGA